MDPLLFIIISLFNTMGQRNNYGIDSETYPHLKDVRVRRQIDYQPYVFEDKNQIENGNTPDAIPEETFSLKSILKGDRDIRVKRAAYTNGDYSGAQNNDYHNNGNQAHNEYKQANNDNNQRNGARGLVNKLVSGFLNKETPCDPDVIADVVNDGYNRRHRNYTIARDSTGFERDDASSDPDTTRYTHRSDSVHTYSDKNLQGVTFTNNNVNVVQPKRDRTITRNSSPGLNVTIISDVPANTRSNGRGYTRPSNGATSKPALNLFDFFYPPVNTENRDSDTSFDRHHQDPRVLRTTVKPVSSVYSNTNRYNDFGAITTPRYGNNGYDNRYDDYHVSNTRPSNGFSYTNSDYNANNGYGSFGNGYSPNTGSPSVDTGIRNRNNGDADSNNGYGYLNNGDADSNNGYGYLNNGYNNKRHHSVLNLAPAPPTGEYSYFNRMKRSYPYYKKLNAYSPTTNKYNQNTNGYQPNSNGHDTNNNWYNSDNNGYYPTTNKYNTNTNGYQPNSNGYYPNNNEYNQNTNGYTQRYPPYNKQYPNNTDFNYNLQNNAYNGYNYTYNSSNQYNNGYTGTVKTTTRPKINTAQFMHGFGCAGLFKYINIGNKDLCLNKSTPEDSDEIFIET